MKLTRSKLKEIVRDVMNESYRQGDKFELGKDLDYGDEKLHAGDYELVRPKGPHQYQLKDIHSGQQYMIYKKDFEKYTKKKQFKQINEAKKKVDISKLSVGNTYKDSKGYPVKIVDIGGGGNSWKITYKDSYGKTKTIKTSISKGVNLYESINNNTIERIKKITHRVINTSKLGY